MAEDLNIPFEILTDPQRTVVTAYGVADAGPDLAMPAVFVISQDGVITWRVIGESMRDVPPASAVLDAVASAAGSSSDDG